MPKDFAKPKQTRKRIPRTCAQCRKRKQKCDSLKPCAVCKLRGEAELCDYSGAQPTRVLDEEDETINQISAEELKILREQVEDLEKAVTLVINHTPTEPNPQFSNDIHSRLSIDMDELNLANVLSNLLVCRMVTPEFSQELPIIQRVRRQCRLDQHLPPAPPSNIYATRGLSTYFNNQLNHNHYTELHRRLPTYEQSTEFLAIYTKQFEWYHSCFNADAYTNALVTLHGSSSSDDPEKDIQSRFVTMAICFAIARSAIVSVSAQQATKLNLPIEPSERLEQSKVWFELSVACLKCADFEVNPLLESVTALIILLEVTWFDVTVGGMEDLSTLFDLKCKAMHLAFDLSLHRDPSHRDPTGTVHVNAAVARERRMIWWALLSIDGLFSDLTGRMSSIVGLEAVDVFLPALSTKAHPDELHEGCEHGCTTSTPATGIKPRLLIGYVGHEISRLPHQRNPLPTINDIHQAHRDLVSLEVHLPEGYKLSVINGHSTDRSRLPKCSKARRDAVYFYMRYHYLFVKLHRPLHFIKKGQFEKSSDLEMKTPYKTSESEVKIPYHRSAVVDHSLLLLDLRSICNFSPDYIYGNAMALEASFSLALEYLYDPKSDVSNLIKVELQNYCKFLQNSSVWLIKRGLKILECLMATWETPPPTGTISWFSTNKGPCSPSSWIQGPYHQPPELSFPSAEMDNQLSELNTTISQAQPSAYACLRVFESPELASGAKLINHSSWAPSAALIDPHSSPSSHPGQAISHPGKAVSHPGKAVSHPGQAVSHPGQAVSHPGQAVSHPQAVMAPHYQQGTSQQQLSNHNTSMAEQRNPFVQFKQQPNHAQVIFNQEMMSAATAHHHHPPDPFNQFSSTHNPHQQPPHNHYESNNNVKISSGNGLNLEELFNGVSSKANPTTTTTAAARFENHNMNSSSHMHHPVVSAHAHLHNYQQQQQQQQNCLPSHHQQHHLPPHHHHEW